MNWRDHLTDQERNRLDEIRGESGKLKAEYRRIYDRCRKRMGPVNSGNSRNNPEPSSNGAAKSLKEQG